VLTSLPSPGPGLLLDGYLIAAGSRRQSPAGQEIAGCSSQGLGLFDGYLMVI